MFDIVDIGIDQHIRLQNNEHVLHVHTSAWTLEHALGTGVSQPCNAVHTHGMNTNFTAKTGKKWDNSKW